MKETFSERLQREALERAAPGTKVEFLGLYEGVDVARVDAIERLLAARRVPQMLNRNGFVVVPIDGGVRDVMIEPVEVYGERCIELWMLLRVDVVRTQETPSVLAECMVDLSRNHGPRMTYREAERTIILRHAVPEVSLTSDALLSAVNVLGRAAREMEERLDKAGLGEAPLSVAEQRGWPRITDSYRTD